MASFKYTFQKIVDLKGSEKTQAEWMLSEAIAQLRQHEEQQQQLKMLQNEWEQKLEQSVIHSVPLQEVLIIQHYIDFYKQAIKDKQMEIEQASIDVELRREQLANKMKEEKVWDKAKENAFAKFRYSMQLREQNELDEMASIRFMSPTP